ncbi:MAG: DUF1592 domain-containing protein [Armatimonadota bacterium]
MTDRLKSRPPALGLFASAAAMLAAVVTGVAASGAAPAKPKPPAKPAAKPAAPTKQELEQRFTRVVRPFMQSYCIGCHGANKPQAQLDLSGYTTMASVASDFGHWSLVLERMAVEQMPPPNAKQPSAAQRKAVIGWIQALREYEANRNAGDPGLVLARRLSNAEYDYTVRDLTGVDIRPTKEFPVDPANQEGFDNSGESLTVSPALTRKYVQAARTVADHLVLKPEGFDFAPHPTLAPTDRDKYSILRIVDFYKQQPTDLADYFLAAWRYRHRAALGMPQASLADVAAQSRVSPRYLETVWKTLTAPGEKVGPIAKLQQMWSAMPAPQGKSEETARGMSAAIRDWVTGLRKKVAFKFDNLWLPGFSPGGQCFVMWKNRQYASHRRKLNVEALQVNGVPKPRTVTRSSTFGARAEGTRTIVDPVDPELFVPGDEKERAVFVDSFTRFCSVFPDAFYISERGRMFIDDPNDKGRLLSAGLHNAMGYFRDDTPLMELVLDEEGRRKLDRLWLDFDFVAFIPERMHLEFFHYERAETDTLNDPMFDFAKAEDADATSEAKIKKLAELYLAKARRSQERNNASPVTIQAIEEHFRIVNSSIRAIEKARKDAEPSHVTALLDFAQRAYRRPLTTAERESLAGFYRSMREQDGLSHEDAIRDGVVSVLMSPHFLFRVDLEASAPAARPAAPAASGAKVRTASAAAAAPAPVTLPSGQKLQPLSDYALASRLSYFLWSSAPDALLLARAKAGDLHQPEVLASEARRMLSDPRVRRLAVEFGGNWLDFRRFEEHNAVDRERFKSFNDELRTAMFEEPVRFLTDTFQQNRSVLDLLFGKHTFVNAPLARHYGMDDVKVPENGWVRVENADRYSRGGLLPMAVFMTANSPGLRTSPVKRGYWVVRRVLGEHIPPPPPTVPELPGDEEKLGDLTLRQLLEKHRESPACSPCHARFDSYGLVFEGYGPVGDVRARDLGGKPVDTAAPFPGGDRKGLAGLIAFIREQRQNDFVDNLCRKLLSYSLGRTLQPSDDPLLRQMRARLAANDYRFDTLVESIVTSRQFRYRRGPVASVKSVEN